jgi:hypothetical protein
LLILFQKVFEKLKQLFLGFEDSGAAPVFLLMGSFVSKAATASGGREAARNSYRLLADAITAAPRIAREAKFVLVPGENSSLYYIYIFIYICNYN